MSTLSVRPPPLTEMLSEALRKGDRARFRSCSPYAACLDKLLDALGWNHLGAEVIESLPHFTDVFGLTEYRNALVSLGYEDTELHVPACRLDPSLLPCLYIAKNRRHYVLLESTDKGFRYFDAESLEEHVDTLAGIDGVAYVLTDTHQSHGNAQREHASEPFSARLLSRFSKLVVRLMLLTCAINLAALAIPLFIMLVYDNVIGAKSADALPFMIAGVTIALCADLGFRQIRARMLGSLAGRLDYLIGVESFRQLLSMPPVYTERSTVTAQLQRLQQFESIREFFTGSGATVLLEFPFAILSILVITLIAGPIAWIPLVAIVAYVLISLVSVPAISNQMRNSGSATSDKQRMLMQTLAGRTEIKAIGGEDLWRERYREVSGESAMTGYSCAVTSAVATSVGQLVMNLSALGVMGFGAASVIAGEISIGALIATMALTWRILTPLQSGFLAVPRIRQVLKSMKQIDQLMKIKVERDGAQSGLMKTSMMGNVVLDRVSMRYGQDENPALLGVSMQARPGQIVAIVGDSGSGKSSLLKLIAGMYKPQAGALYLDNLDLRQLNVKDLRRSVAYVPQDVRLFHGTIVQNLRLNNSAATFDELQLAARQAGIAEDIAALPDAWSTKIGDHATDRFAPAFLRGLTLARALLRPAKVLLLDEPGAGMDEDSDLRFQEQLKKLRGNRTVIMATHRPSHARLADQVLYLEHGTVKFFGDPEKAISAMLRQDR